MGLGHGFMKGFNVFVNEHLTWPMSFMAKCVGWAANLGFKAYCAFYHCRFFLFDIEGSFLESAVLLN